jgi:hypothetical protein
MNIYYLQDFILSRYHNIEYVLSLSIDNFTSLYTEAIESQRVDKLWIAYVMWKPDLSFSEFLNSNKPSNDENNIENGCYIDQIGFL